MPLPSSPCIKVCVMDMQSRLCTGCGRSLEEIGRWSGMSEAERRAIMLVLPDRVKATLAVTAG